MGFLGGVIFTGIAINQSAGRMMLKEMKSPYDHQKTVDTIVSRVQAAPGWHVVKVYDMNKEILENGGEAVGKYAVIQYCSGKYAGRMLAADGRKRIGAMMPKNFAVYEKADGQVYVTSANGAVMGKLFGGETEGIIEEVSLEVEGMLRFMNFKFSLF
jgi:uncharacterized protein (DUF302 family)